MKLLIRWINELPDSFTGILVVTLVAMALIRLFTLLVQS